MGYKVMILGKSYDLPARTLAVDDKIDEIGSLDRAYRAGEITRRESVEIFAVPSRACRLTASTKDASAERDVYLCSRSILRAL